MTDKLSPKEVEASRKALEGWADHLDERGSAFLGIHVHTARAQEVLEYMEDNFPIGTQTLSDEEPEDRVSRALLKEDELREAGHEPFEWSFGQGPVYSCKLCAEAGLPPSETEWPCSVLRNEVARTLTFDQEPQQV